MPPIALRPYAIALILLSAAVGLRLLLDPLLGPYLLSHPTVFTAILLATLYYGPRPGILVAILGYPAVEYWIRPEPFMGSPATVATTLALYAALCALVIGLTHRFRLEHQALMAAARERERHEERLHRQANFDALTGLVNRSLFFDRLNQALLHARRHRLTAALLFVDLNHFNSINDSYGHVAGDQLLMQIAAALTATVRREDTVARLGGDEFAILLPQIDTHQHAALLAEKVLAVISRPYPVDGGQATISAAVGVALSSDCSGDGASFVNCADMAMFRCKKNGKGAYELFHREMAAEAARVRSMQQRLREALARDEFVLHYQPKVSFSNGTMTGCEALLRWQPSEQGLVMPGAFIGNLEESGLIVDIGDWVVREACAQIARWQGEGLGIPVAVNVSAKQLRPEFVNTVQAALDDTMVNGSLLQIELTESSAMQRTDNAIDILNELRAIGLKVAIDDFGTGYSSLSLLQRLPVDVVKIDRSFVAGLPHNANDASICRAVIQMAHSLNLRVIAEGIEHRRQYVFLKEHACDEAQGYLLGRPAQAAKLTDLSGPLKVKRLDDARERVCPKDLP